MTKEGKMRERLYDVVAEHDGEKHCVEIDLSLEAATKSLAEYKASGWKAYLVEVVRDKNGNLIAGG